MKRRRLPWSGALLAFALASPNAHAQALGTLGLGAGAGSITHADGLSSPYMPSFLVEGGFATQQWRAGGDYQLSNLGTRGWASALGLYVSFDIANVWLDDRISAGFFVRADHWVRYVHDANQFALPVLASAGARVGGVALQSGFGPQLEQVGNGTWGWGWTFESRLTVELVEFGRFVSGLSPH